MRQTLIGLFCLTSFFVAAQDDEFQKAELLYKDGDFQKSLDAYRSAGEAYRTQESLDEYVLSNIRMAECHNRLANYQQSIKLLQNTNTYLNEVLGTNKYLEAEINRVTADSWLNLGRNAKALDLLKLAENMYPDDQPGALAECYNLLGVVYQNNENTALAQQYHQRALNIRMELFGDNSIEVADSKNNLGVILLGLEDITAGDLFDEVRAIYEQSYGTLHPKVAFSMINLAQARSIENQLFESLSLINKVEQIWQEILPDNHPNIAFTKIALGQIMARQNNLDDALKQYHLALTMYSTLYGNKHPDVANAYFLIGRDVYQKRSEFKKAIASFQEAIYALIPDQEYLSTYDLPQIDGNLNPDILLTSLMSKARMHEAIHFEKSLKPKDLFAALKTYDLADRLVNEIRRVRLNESDKLRLGATARDIYENGIRLSLVLADQPIGQSKHLERAFNYAERTKSSVLLSAIQDTNAKSYAGIPSSYLGKEDSIKTYITLLQEKISNGEEIESNRTKLFDAQKVYFDLIATLESEFPSYYNLKYQTSTMSLADLQSNLDAFTAVIMYLDTKEEVIAITVSKKNVQVTSQVKSDDFRKTVSGFRNGIKYRIDDAFKPNATKLYDLLIPTIPKQISKLILLPDGVLSTLPFEALIHPTTKKYLIQDYTVSYDYSAGLLVERGKKPGIDNHEALLLAPVEFDYGDMRLSQLPGTEKESREIMYLFDARSEKTNRLTKKKATETAIKQTDILSRYQYIHFATHGMVNESKPEQSRIFLTADNSEDGFLYSADLYNLKINADLVSLSACETGLGKIDKGEGVLGLSRALLYAGSRNLLVSLWKVSDAATSRLMIEFYHQHLLTTETEPFNRALRLAKLDLIQSEEFNEPYFWAAFILVGK
ncbi:MAG: CHAT domain-containing protein [Cyclobacteriaceae bacterium]